MHQRGRMRAEQGIQEEAALKQERRRISQRRSHGVSVSRGVSSRPLLATTGSPRPASRSVSFAAMETRKKGWVLLEEQGWRSTRAGRWIDPDTGRSYTAEEAWSIIMAPKVDRSAAAPEPDHALPGTTVSSTP